MADTTAVYARIDTGLKNSAEEILAKLGVTPASAIQMLYSQIIMHNGLPFSVRIPAAKPIAIGGMSREELDAELAKGIASLDDGILTADEFDAKLDEEFGI